MGCGGCNGAWHGACYKKGREDQFPVLVARDLNNSIIDDNLLEADDVLRFKNARDSHHMMVPFQCDNCHF